MKTDEQRGAFAAWLRRQRKAQRPPDTGWKEAQTRQALEAAVPGVSFSTYRDIEAGNRKPTDEQRQAIELVFGPIPDFRPAVEPTDLAAAITRQAEAIEKQADALAGFGDEIRKAALRVTGALTAYGDLLVLVANRLGVDPASIGAEVAALSLGQEDGQDQ